MVAGLVVRHELLGSSAIYRIVDADAQFVMVSVIDAPGLEAHQTLRLTRSAVLAMSPMPD